MSLSTIEILEQLKTLTSVEAAELVKQIEVTFNVDVSSERVIKVFPDKQDDSLKIEPLQTELDVVLEEVPTAQKIAILKVVRTLTGLALKEAKEFVESVPKVVNSGIPLEAAEDIKQQLEAVGGKVSLK